MGSTGRSNKKFSDTIEWMKIELPDLCDAYHKIPAQRQLANMHGCSLGTIRKAIAELETQGFLSTRHGYGTFLNQAVTFNHREEEAGRRQLLALVPVGTNKAGQSLPFAPYLMTLCRAMQREAESLNYNLMLKTFEFDEGHAGRHIDEFLQLAEDEQCAGVILASIWQDEVQQRIFNLGKPGVLVDHHAAKGVKWDSIEPDTFGHAREIVMLLSNMGHETVALMEREGERNPDMHAGIESAVAALDGKLSCSVLTIPRGRSKWQQSMQQIIADWRSKDGVPHAVIGSNYPYLPVFCAELEKSDIHVPEDISVVGFPDLIQDSDYSLSGIVIDWRDIGSIAVNKLNERIQNKNKTVEVIKRIFPFQFGETVSVHTAAHA